jgi:uncharacterized membrane protein YgdD (TMEM256/DUF423 family)
MLTGSLYVLTLADGRKINIIAEFGGNFVATAGYF